MIRMLFRLVIVIVVLAVLGGWYLGYRFENGTLVAPGGGQKPAQNIGETLATTATDTKQALAEMTLEGKIKSKMALDDLVKAADISIDSDKGVVTLTGTVSSEAERERALRIARETDGVTKVTDRLVVRK